MILPKYCFLKSMYGFKYTSRNFPVPSKFNSRDHMILYHPVNGWWADLQPFTKFFYGHIVVVHFVSFPKQIASIINYYFFTYTWAIAFLNIYFLHYFFVWVKQNFKIIKKEGKKSIVPTKKYGLRTSGICNVAEKYHETEKICVPVKEKKWKNKRN